MAVPTTIGVAWRPAIARFIDELAQAGELNFTEVVAENVEDPTAPPPALVALREAGVTVVPHGVTLGLAGAEFPDVDLLDRLAGLAEVLKAPFVSEHVAFVRAGDDHGGSHDDVLEAGHLVPPPRTRESLAVLCDNVKRAQDALPVPLACENIAATLRWPEDELDEPTFLTALTERTGCLLVLDVANLYATCSAAGSDAHAQLRRFPLESVAYVHVAGGIVRDGIYLDTHAHPILGPVVDLLADLVSMVPDPMTVLLERDRNLSTAVMAESLAVVRAAAGRVRGARP
ncbi:MAG: DUF692 family protein [Actinomycetota bacterium]|nr:DUF692 family protein [Actinomycetota bacterium]